MTTHEAERGVVSCAICLTQKSAEEAYLDGCFHRFCLACISNWTESQRQHPPAGAAPGFVCPLCKTPYASILHDYRHNAYKRKWVAQQSAGAGSLPDGADVDLTPLQRRRRASYFSPCSAPRASSSSSGGGNGAAMLTAAQATRTEVAASLRRELEALMLENDVGMVVAHIVGTLRSATGGPAKHRRGAASTAGASREAVSAAVAAAAQPYVFEHAARFTQELLGFAASGRTIAAHDLATGMAGCNSKSAAASATAAAEEDGSRESGELSPSQPADSQDDSSSGDGAAAAVAAASSGGTAAAAAGPAANADAGSGVRRSPSPDRGSDCLSLSVGSDFGDSDSEAYLPLVQASAAAQRRKLEAVAAGGSDSEPELDGNRTGGGAEDLASSPPRSKRHRSHPDAGRPERRRPEAEAAVDRRHGQGADAHGNAAADVSKPQRQHKRRRQRRHDSQQPAEQPRVAAPMAAEPKGAAAAAAAADADAQRMLRRAAKFGVPLPAPLPPPGPPSVATAAAAPSTDGHSCGAAANSTLRHSGKHSAGGSSKRSGTRRQTELRPHGGRPCAHPTALKPGQLRPFVEVEAVLAQAAAIESPTIAPLLPQQGGSEAGGVRGSGQQHHKQHRWPADSQGGGSQPVPAPGRSSDSATVRSGDGAAQGASNAARHARKRGRADVPSLGGGLRIFRSAMAADAPPLRENGNKPRAGRGVASGSVGGGGSSGGANSSVGSKDLELLRKRALAAHAVAKP